MAAKTSIKTRDGSPPATSSEIAALSAVVAAAAAMADRIESEAAHGLLLRALGLLQEREPADGDSAAAGEEPEGGVGFKPS